MRKLELTVLAGLLAFGLAATATAS